jgi:hypothetical protein
MPRNGTQNIRHENWEHAIVIWRKFSQLLTHKSICCSKHLAVGRHVFSYTCNILQYSAIQHSFLPLTFSRIYECVCLKIELKILPCFVVGPQWSSWLRHCATNRKGAGSIPDGVTGIFHWHKPGVEYFLGVKRGRCLGLPPSCADCLEIW